MKKGLMLTLQDAELIELCRVLIDKDAEGALEFLQAHLKGKARDLLEGGRHVMIDVPGAGITHTNGNIFAG